MWIKGLQWCGERNLRKRKAVEPRVMNSYDNGVKLAAVRWHVVTQPKLTSSFLLSTKYQTIHTFLPFHPSVRHNYNFPSPCRFTWVYIFHKKRQTVKVEFHNPNICTTQHKLQIDKFVENCWTLTVSFCYFTILYFSKCLHKYCFIPFEVFLRIN